MESDSSYPLRLVSSTKPNAFEIVSGGYVDQTIVHSMNCWTIFHDMEMPMCLLIHFLKNIQIASSWDNYKQSAINVYTQMLCEPKFSFPQGRYLGVWLPGHYGKPMFKFIFFKKPIKLFPEWISHLTFLPTIYESSSCSISLPTLGTISDFFFFFHFRIPTAVL